MLSFYSLFFYIYSTLITFVHVPNCFDHLLARSLTLHYKAIIRKKRTGILLNKVLILKVITDNSFNILYASSVLDSDRKPRERSVRGLCLQWPIAARSLSFDLHIKRRKRTLSVYTVLYLTWVLAFPHPFFSALKFTAKWAQTYFQHRPNHIMFSICGICQNVFKVCCSSQSDSIFILQAHWSQFQINEFGFTVPIW